MTDALPDPGPGEPTDRWPAVLPHRDRLLRIARVRCDTVEDAEDCVQEALVRCVTFERLDPDRIGSFLTSVVVRLCVDLRRGAHSADVARARLSGFADTTDDSPEDAVCDRLLGASARARLGELPPRERDVLTTRARGLSVAETASALNISYKSAGSALTRARIRMRDLLEIRLPESIRNSGEEAAPPARNTIEPRWGRYPTEEDECLTEAPPT